jgi:hypothetical protein
VQIREWDSHLRQTVAAVDVDAAIAEGKVAASQRELALAAAERDPSGFRRAMASAPQIFGPIPAADQKRAAALSRFQAKVIAKLKADPKLEHSDAQSQVAAEEPEIYAAAMGR